MTDQNDRDIREALRRFDGDAPAPLEADLWPRMRARLDEPRPRPSAIDWALAGGIAAAAVLFPQIILGVLYQL